MTILGIIPARGGSKGIPRKNIKPILGRPLVAWTIEAARNSSLLDRFVVSTEDPEIAAVAEHWGAEVLPRPAELAGDDSSSRDVIRHALESTGADVSVLLQPTSPVRDPDLIDRAVQAFVEGGYDSLATGRMLPVYPPHGEEHRRQDIGYVFVNDGSLIVSTRATILAGSLFGQSRGTMVTDKWQNVDIDDEFDFWIAEQILRKRMEERAVAEGPDVESLWSPRNAGTAVARGYRHEHA
ncbi:MAG: acylneuraminate cytidylyltransferase family protein [Proteobacteria bacterium]|nr:acylneuraminate cytidylyltransferase family protein [Pseudomonadota bacterium]